MIVETLDLPCGSSNDRKVRIGRQALLTIGVIKQFSSRPFIAILCRAVRHYAKTSFHASVRMALAMRDGDDRADARTGCGGFDIAVHRGFPEQRSRAAAKFGDLD